MPAAHYKAGWLHELFFGAHWRDVWSTPVKVGVIDLSKYGGGLTPTEKGGGFQTKALKFKGGDGKEYKFRSLDKDPQKTLPKELQESIARDVVQDQISSSNPYAGFVVNEILDSVGVFHSDYTLALLPDDPALGEYQKEFAGLLGIMEIVPDKEQFEGSDKVINTVKLLDRLNKEYDESVDSKEFLKARLIDIYLGDWDRHKDQWKWIRFEDGENKIYKPFPMDRDQAFAKFDGLLPWIAEQNVPQLNNFGYNYPDMRFMTWSGRYIDQRFLTFLSRAEWESITNEVLSELTNNLIESAVKKLPPEVYLIAKDELTGKLKSRRDGLKEASDEYYELVNSVVDIYTTDKDDIVELNSSNDQMMLDKSGIPVINISIYGRDKNTGDKGKLIRYKEFNSDITDEIRIYTQDGDDLINVQGSYLDFPKIRIIGGDGKDEVFNKTSETVIFYDDGKKSKYSGNVCYDDSKYLSKFEKLQNKLDEIKGKISKEDKKKKEEEIANFRYDPVTPPDKFYMTSFIPVFNYSPDIGPFFGGTYYYSKYGFRMDPYLYKLQLMLGYAPEKKNITGLVADLNLDMRSIIRNSAVNFHARKSGIQVNNYFGMGNNTTYRKSAEDSGVYKLKNEEYILNPEVTFLISNPLQFKLGVKYKKFDLIRDEYRFIPGLNRNINTNLIGLTWGMVLDKRDNITSPFKGYFLNINAGYFGLLDKVYDYAKFSADLRGYIGYKQNVSLALRLWGEKLFNNYPFYESAFLGGSKLLRGYPSERFAGDGSLLASTEGRLSLFKMNLLLPETIGIFGFAETGRVFLDGERSDKWHISYGGGLFMFLINRDITFKFTYARSEEKDFSLYFGTGFGF